MSAPTLTDIDLDVTVTDEPDPAPAPAPLRGRRTRRKRRRTWRTSRFAYALVAPAVCFMVLVHVLPAAGGLVLSFKNLNTFTFSQLYAAPWAGLENYRSILFDADNPLHSGFFGRCRTRRSTRSGPSG
jgi:multiple sugar transport system permease protein